MTVNTLDNRPEARTLTVADLLSTAQAGRIRVPRFQTGMRWQAKQVVELFDSLARGFPVGNLLLAAQQAPAELLDFGPLNIAAVEAHEAWYVVDGQQRVTAIVAALAHPEVFPTGDRWSVWVDLHTSAFAVHRTRPAAHWIPARLLGDRPRLHQWARSFQYGEHTEAMVQRAFDIEERIMRYEIPAYIVRNADEALLRQIFSRSNSSGVALGEDQVFSALFPGSEANTDPLAALSSSIHDASRFGRLPAPWLLRCVKAVAKADPRTEFQAGDSRVDAAIAETRRALLHAIRFLQTDARIPHESVLPYRFPLIVLARLFSEHPTLEPRDRSLLVRWIWRGALTGEHAKSSHGEVRSQLAEVGEDASETVQRLLRRVDAGRASLDLNSLWNGRSAASRIFALIAIAAEPMDPDTDAPIPIDHLLDRLNRHDLGEVVRRASNHPANALLDRVFCPVGAHRLAEASEETLSSLIIPAVARSALRAGDAAAFIAAREPLLRATADRWIALMTGAQSDDRPPIQAILKLAGSTRAA